MFHFSKSSYKYLLGQYVKTRKYGWLFFFIFFNLQELLLKGIFGNSCNVLKVVRRWRTRKQPSGIIDPNSNAKSESFTSIEPSEITPINIILLPSCTPQETKNPLNLYYNIYFSFHFFVSFWKLKVDEPKRYPHLLFNAWLKVALLISLLWIWHRCTRGCIFDI